MKEHKRVKVSLNFYAALRDPGRQHSQLPHLCAAFFLREAYFQYPGTKCKHSLFFLFLFFFCNKLLAEAISTWKHGLFSMVAFN